LQDSETIASTDDDEILESLIALLGSIEAALSRETHSASVCWRG
jgi:hypothetical protein